MTTPDFFRTRLEEHGGQTKYHGGWGTPISPAPGPAHQRRLGIDHPFMGQQVFFSMPPGWRGETVVCPRLTQRNRALPLQLRLPPDSVKI